MDRARRGPFTQKVSHVIVRGMQEAQPSALSSPEARNLFLMGFLTLFLELALIRYLPGNIWNLGYFPNLVLIAVFIGMGLGFMLHQYATPRLSGGLLHASMWLLLGLILFVTYGHPAVPGFSNWQGDMGGDLYFTATSKAAAGQSVVPFIVCLVGVATIFAFLSQRTAKLFRRFPPLTAYTLDIAGSCAGILAFIVMSFLGTPAWVWFALFAGLFVLSLGDFRRTLWLPLIPALVIVFLVRREDGVLLGAPEYRGALESFWSPYQRVQYRADRRSIYVNGVGHQSMKPRATLRKQFYQKVYDGRRREGGEPYRDVLILGAGSGNDVAAALMNRAEHVDAVEIDPAIAGIGKRHHPEKPYQDPRVNLVIDDGRAFMTRTPRRYDLVIFALTDSLVKVSSMSQLRLENYLFTVESVRRARGLLKPGGDLVFYNYYRQPWLRTKISEMIQEATGLQAQPIVEDGDFVVLKAHDGAAVSSGFQPTLDLPRDDWPFLYLVQRDIPRVYGWAMFGMCLFAACLVALLHRSTRRQERYGRPGMLATKLAFVFMGIAFLLLETKSVVQFSLLFGTTWLNSSLVFLAALLLVLMANWAAVWIRDRRWMSAIYACLILSCLVAFVWPLGNLLSIESALARFLLASVMTFAPIFFANLVFSLSFREQDVPEHLFGWNLIGATVGGVLEYSSMYFGYSFLAVVVAVSYAIVIVLLVSARRSQATGQSARP
jgi:Spermine/spermidine synthase domain